jgi:protein-S-isoprenylcysteine O-methyltransferase Ste14
MSTAFNIHAHITLPDIIHLSWTAPSVESPAVTAIFLLGWVATLSSGVLRDYCYKTLGRMFTYEITLRDGHQLVTTGPYGYVRHPSYSGVVLGVVGTLLMAFGPGTWFWSAGVYQTVFGAVYALLWTAMELFVLYSILARAPIEDALLKKQFGKEWEEWAARVQYRVIPGIF